MAGTGAHSDVFNNVTETPAETAARLAKEMEKASLDDVRRKLFDHESSKNVIPAAASQGLMPDKYDGGPDFRVWQDKMLYWLSSLHVDKYLKEDKPVVPPGNTDVFVTGSVDNWVQGDYCCKGQILSRLTDKLFKLYSNNSKYGSSKALWLALENQYKADDSAVQRFSTAKFLNFKMVDSKPIEEQVEALQRIWLEMEIEGMSICNITKANSLIEKLPPGWSDFKNYLNFKRKAVSLDDLIRRLRVEENNRGTHKGIQNQGHAVHVAEQKANHTGKGKGVSTPKKTLKVSSQTNFKKNSSEKKFKGKCHHCGKIGHKAEVCKSKARDLKAQANLTEEDMVAVATECNMVDDNPLAWFYDTGATTHICADRSMFSTYVKNKSDAQLFMGNTSVSKIEGTSKVILQLTSGRELTLSNVKHVPDMRKNLISGTALSNRGFAVSFVSDKLVLKKFGVMLG